MAKSKRAEEPAGIGDNLTEDEIQRALLIHHFDKLRQQEAKVALKKSAYDAERDAMNELFAVAKADKFTRKELQALLDDTKAMRRNLTAEEERRARLRTWLGLPAGTQGDLFNSPLEIQDEAHAKGQGYAAGLRGEPCQMPEGMEVRFGPSFAAGWGKGQEELAWGLAAAGRIVDRRANANANPVALSPEPEDEPEADPLDPDAVKAEADRLKDSGWTQPTPAEAEFEAA